MFDRLSQPEELFAALQHLKHNKHEVILFHILDKRTELDFEFEERPYRFIDLETGRQVRVQPGQIRSRYVETLERFRKEMKIRCGQYHIDIVDVDILAGFEQVLLPYLVKRSKLY
jgi:hypothetical protein